MGADVSEERKAGKGDKARRVDQKRYDANHDAIRWRSKAQKKKACK